MNIEKRKSTFPSLLGDEFDNLFQGFFRPVAGSDFLTKATKLPAVDVEETKDNFVLMADMPGFDKEDIHVSFHDGQLTIKAEHKEESEKQEKGEQVLKERRYGSYYRTLHFGNNIAEHDISASYKNGVLELTLPKLGPAAPTARKIEIGG